MTNRTNELSEVSDEVFALVARELATGKPDEALWTKAFALQNGNESATKAHYIRLRAEQIQREASGRIEAESKLAADDASPIAGPWARYFARYLDLTVGVCLTLLLFLLLMPTIKVANVQMTGLVLVVLGLAALLPWVIDAAIVTVFGNSLGKAIWGITVRHKDGHPLAFKEVLNRNILVGLHGFWTGITPLTFLPHIFSYRKLKRDGITKWDDKGQYEVLSSNPGVFRKICGVILLVVAFGLLALMDVATRLNVRNTTDATTANTKQTESTAQVPLPTVVTPDLSNDPNWKAGTEQKNRPYDDILYPGRISVAEQQRIMRNGGVGGTQSESDVRAWGAGRLLTLLHDGDAYQLAMNGVEQWKSQIVTKAGWPDGYASYMAFIIQLDYISKNMVCFPDLSRDGGLTVIDQGNKFEVFPTCHKLTL